MSAPPSLATMFKSSTPRRACCAASLLALACLFAVPEADAQGKSGSSDYRVYDVAAAQERSLPALADALAPAGVVFFGEIHDDSLGHALQDSLYALLLARYGEVTLSLEMFEADVQPVVDEYLAGLIPLDRLEGDGRAWDTYATDYHPLVERAKASGQRVVAANAPRRYVRLVGQQGATALARLPDASRDFLPRRPYRYVDTAYRRRFFALMGGMPGHDLGEDGERGTRLADLNPIFAAQTLWDATMAWRIAEAHDELSTRIGKVYHLAGRFHVDYRLGTVAQLRERARKLRSASLIVVEVEDLDAVDWVEYADRGDFVIAHE